MLPQRAADTEQRIRRMLRRLKLSAQDVEAWLGILRHVQWRNADGEKAGGVTCPFGIPGNEKSFTLGQMSDRIVCSCITCPKCGTWVVVEREMTRETNKEKLSATCPGPECGKQFSFAPGETKVFELADEPF